MQFQVAGLLKSHRGATQSFEVDEEPQFRLSVAKLAGPVTGNVVLMRTQQGILVQANLQVEAEMQCARCLEATRAVLEAHISEEFKPMIDIYTGFRIWPEPGEQIDEETLIDEHHILDLDEAVRQEMEASIPIKPLCSADCAGICPQCGKNLNEGPCDCQPEIDERWHTLKDILSASATE